MWGSLHSIMKRGMEEGRTSFDCTSVAQQEERDGLLYCHLKRGRLLRGEPRDSQFGRETRLRFRV